MLGEEEQYYLILGLHFPKEILTHPREHTALQASGSPVGWFNHRGHLMLSAEIFGCHGLGSDTTGS